MPLLSPPRARVAATSTPQGSGAALLPTNIASSAAGVRPQTSTAASFEALEAFRMTSSATDSTPGVEPPDTQTAVGPSYVTEAVNDTLSVWTRTGSPVVSASLNAFFPVPTANGYYFSDPRIVYDGLSGRWFLSGMGVNPAASSSYVYLAVSTSSDPTGGWNIYEVAYGATVIADQPKLGLSSDKVVLSWNDFSGSTFTGQETWVLQKSDLLSGLAVSSSAFGSDPTRNNVVPVVSQTPTSSEYLVYNNTCSGQSGVGVGSCTAGTSTLGVVAIDGTPAAGNVTWTEADPAVAATVAPPAGTQPSGPAIETNDDRLLSAVWQNGNLWASGNDGCIPSSSVQSCLRLFEVSTTSDSVLVDGDIGSAGQDLYYPAVTLDSSGDPYVVATQSSSTLYPSVLVLGESASSGGFVGVGLPEPDGGASYNGTRWGDYSGAAVDPLNPNDVWVAGEYSTRGGNPDWGTAAAELTFEQVPQVGPGGFVALTPTRVLDTRYGTGGTAGPVGAGQTVSLPVLGWGGVPDSGVAAVVLNVTVTQPTRSGYLTVYPDGAARPLASNLNFSAGETVPNLVIAPVGPDGQVDFYNGSAGTVQIVADVSGWFASGSPGAGGLAPLTPTRILDTRYGTGVPAGPVGAARTISLSVLGQGGVPPSGVAAVVLNVTVTQPHGGGYLTVYPDQSARPVASNLNFSAGETVPNLVIAPVGPDGRVDFYNGSGGTAHIVADVSGWFAPSPPAAGGLAPLTPARVLDTRYGTGGIAGPVGAARTIGLSVLGQGGVPGSGVSAVVLNVTVTQAQGGGYLTVYPGGAARPLASNLNFSAGETVPNLVIAPVGPDGRVDFYDGSGGAVQIVADVSGWFSN
jgi:hypothetical protein